MYSFTCFRTNVKLHKILVTTKLIKKVITDLDSSKESSPNWILLAVPKNWKLSYLLAELFNMCLKKSFFADCWKVSRVVPIFKYVTECFLAKNYLLVSFLLVKFSKSILSNIIPDLLKKFSLFWVLVWFQDFSFNLVANADRLTAASYRIMRF